MPNERMNPTRQRRDPSAPTGAIPFLLSHWRAGALILAALAVAALVADLTGWHRQARSRAVGTQTRSQQPAIVRADARYVDPSGRFSLHPPAGWKVFERPAQMPYNVVFQGPNGMDLSVQASPVTNMNFAALLAEILAIEKRLYANLHVETVSFAGQPAVRRTCRLFRTKVLTIDFVEADVGHHIQFGCPPETFDEYAPRMLELLESYRAGPD